MLTQEKSIGPKPIDQGEKDKIPTTALTKTKICKKYGPPHERPLTEFSKNLSNADGLDYACKTCMARYRKEANKRRAEKWNIKTNRKKKIKDTSTIPVPIETIQLEAQLLQGVRRALRKEFGEELITVIRENFING